MIRVVLTYEDFFGPNAFTGDRFDLVKDIPKDILIGEFSKINYGLRPINSTYIKLDIDLQKSTMDYFIAVNSRRNYYNTMLGSLKEKYSQKHIAIFNRPATLLGISEILRKGKEMELEKASEYFKENMGEANSESWERIFKYYLLLNSEIWGKSTRQVAH